MKWKLIILCCIISMQGATAQNILTLQTASIGGVTAILPTYDNLFKILQAPLRDYLATVHALKYLEREEDSFEYEVSGSGGQLYRVNKEKKQAEIQFFLDTVYVQESKDAFLVRFPAAKYSLLDKGVEAYDLDLMDGDGKLHFRVLFNIAKGLGGVVTLLNMD